MDITKYFNGLEYDRTSSKPLYLRIAQLFAEKIKDQIIPAGTKLPPERELARLLSVSRTTAINAYRRLEQEGLVRTKVGSGTYVLENIKPVTGRTSVVPWPELFKVFPRTHISSAIMELMDTPVSKNFISMAAGMPDPRLYPLDTFSSLYSKYIAVADPADFGHIPTEGYFPLRSSIARMLKHRGISAQPENIMIVSGSQQGLYLISKAILEPGDYIVVESPTFVGAIQAFQAAGARILSLPGTGSLSLSLLEDYLIRYRPKLFYIMPTFQNPSGRVLSLNERRELLNLASRYGLGILEDDPYRDIYFAGEPPPSLKSLDSSNCVLYLSTFSKILLPGLRIGWLVAPPSVINRLSLDKQYLDLHSGNIAQWLIHLFLEEGNLPGHLLKVRGEYEKRRDAMVNAIRSCFNGELQYEAPDGGFYLWCKLQSSYSSRQLLQEAAKMSVSFVPGEVFFAAPSGDREMRLCFATHRESKLIEGIERLAGALKKTMQNKKNAPVPSGTATRPII